MSLKSSGDKEGGAAADQKLANSLSPKGGDKKRLTLLSKRFSIVWSEYWIS